MRSRVLICALLLAGHTFAQVEQGDSLLAVERYGEALPYYLRVLGADSADVNCNIKAAVCYLHSRSQKEKAIPHLKKVIPFPAPTGSSEKEERIKNEAALPAYKLLGDAYYFRHDLRTALVNYEYFLRQSLITGWEQEESIREAQWKAKMCRMGEAFYRDSLLIDSTGQLLRDYSLSFSGDPTRMSFVFNRFPKRDGDGSFIPTGNRRQPQVQASAMMEDSVALEATLATSNDGQVVLLYKNTGGAASLFTSSLKGNSWSSHEKVSRAINPEGWEPDESVSADGASMYFTAIREDGYGGKDIYRSSRSHDGGWLPAVNLGPQINSAYDDEAPFIHPGGKTLYFSSRRDSGRSGIYASALSDSGIWRAPVKIGYPADKHNEATVDSLPTEKPAGCQVITLLDQAQGSFMLYTGTVEEEEGGIPPGLKINVIDNTTGKSTGIYYPDSEGRFSFFLPVGRDNQVVWEAPGFLSRSSRIFITAGNMYYDVSETIRMDPLKPGAKALLKNVAFEQNTSSLVKLSETELNRVAAFLKSEPGLGVEINTTAEKQGEKEQQKLAEERAEAIARYLAEQGIEKHKIRVRSFERSKKKTWGDSRYAELKLFRAERQRTGAIAGR